MSPDTVSDVIDQDGSLWLIKLVAVRPQRPMVFSEAASRAENRLGNLQTRTLQNQIQDELLAALQVRLTPQTASRAAPLLTPAEP